MNNNLIENRQIRVFISSTFQDMQVERDELMKKTFPFKEMNEKDFVRRELARVRATAMEGSFGTQKEH